MWLVGWWLLRHPRCRRPGAGAELALICAVALGLLAAEGVVAVAHWITR